MSALIAASALIIAFLIALRLASKRSSGKDQDEASRKSGCSPASSADAGFDQEGEVLPDSGYPESPTVDMAEADLTASVRQGPFLVLPYVQLGESGGETLEIAFAVLNGDRRFDLKVDENAAPATRVRLVQKTTVDLDGLRAHYWYRFAVAGFQPGKTVKYSVLEDGVCVFSAETKTALPKEASKYRVAVVGDMGTGRPAQLEIAYRIHQSGPDLLAMTGDIVYRYGRAGEYLRRHFPVYNADRAEATLGAPLLRSVPHFASAGNHCVAKADMFDIPSFDVHPDLYAFYLYWSLPLNGPLAEGDTVSTPHLVGAVRRVDAFLAAAGKRFPTMTNYSFDYGNAHWLVLDANAYMDWTSKKLRDWVEKDLAAASGATWKFVNFHQPPFTSNLKHKREKRMRLLVDIFQKHGVDVVFNGHAHCYERTFPLKFTLEPHADGSVIDDTGLVKGKIELDSSFDGVGKTRPDGVIYIVTGAGGAPRDSEYLHEHPELREPFTCRLIGDRHSFTLLDVDGDKLSLRQIDQDGVEIDVILLTK
ncbi:MAG: metallophosphoesterase [Candidatus Obscuribacterales bacterium]|nr:metallophosphoesterase [Candidatus Obscuribacterales bacterium]